MRRLLLAAATVALTASLGGAGTAGAAGRASVRSAVDAVKVSVDRSQYSVVVGDRFTVLSRITNPSLGPTGRLTAHLNVASLTSDVYVDPEDWSSGRTLEVPDLGPGARTELTWTVQAVNAGSFAIYVVVLPNGAATAGTGPLVVSPPVHVRVAGRRALSASGALPVVLAVPLLLAVAAFAGRSRLTSQASMRST